MPQAKLGRYLISYQNKEEYYRLKQEVFTQDHYYFETDNPYPLIIDAGAHIGMATLYFKRIYPGAHVMALEPHPQSVALLNENIWQNDAQDVEILQVALAARAGTTQLFQDDSSDQWYSTASFFPGAWNGQQKTTAITVKTALLADFLSRPVDCLKMDIEGAEFEVLKAAGDTLRMVKHLWLEFHPHGGQGKAQLLDLLAKYGFTVTAWKEGREIKPLATRGLILLECTRQA